MSANRKTAVVICPGRGTYNKTELGYLGQHFPDADMLAKFDVQRSANNQETLSELDGAKRFSLAKHTRGDNASGLIFAATLGDYRLINSDEIEIVAVTGNSMGWYSALACAGATTPENGFSIANTMGTLMQDALIGGQLVYPFLGADWTPDLARRDKLLALMRQIDAAPGHTLLPSIHLGGMLVLAGNEAGLKAFENTADPVDGRFPMRLGNHAAFHTPMQQPVADKGRERLAVDLLQQPQIPMVDGRGAIWWPHAADLHTLWDYTLGHQVTETYDFTRAVETAAREFAPDLFIVTGPGTTLGGAVAQSLILADWQGMNSKEAFKSLQAVDPVLISMGMADQRSLVT